MKFSRLNLPLAIAVGLLTTSGFAADPTIPSRIDTSIYDSFAQAESDGQVPIAPQVPQEDIFQYRALPPQEAAAEVAEGPIRYLETEFLKKRNISTFGWIEAGVGGNNWGGPFNGTITFNDRAGQVMMNQLYLVNERTLDTEDGGWDIGGRVDLLYGTDYTYTTATGLDAHAYGDYNSLFIPSWNSSKYYGLAMPQLYGEVGRGDVSVKIGHFYTPMGYEVVPAVGNFFYTINNTFQYGEPFTHTGILGNWKANDQLTVYAGVVNGWDNFNSGTPGYTQNTDYNYFDNNAAFLGGVTLKDSEETQSLSIFGYSGNVPVGTAFAPNPFQAISANRSYISTVYSNKLSNKVTYVFQNDNGWQFGLPTEGQPGSYPTVQGQQNNLAQWYGLVNYMFYNFSDKLVGGVRFEYFRDNNGFRVYNPVRNLNYSNFQTAPYNTGYQGNFWEMTWGVNYRPNTNWVIRPELRYDWYSPDKAGGPLPYGSGIGTGAGGDQYGQLYYGGDLIFNF